MKLTVKIALIVLLVAGIVFLVTRFLGGVSDAKVNEVSVTEFEKHIDARVKAEVQGKDFDDATSAFDDIVGEIVTESQVTTGDGKSTITDIEMANTLKYAFYEYQPIFSTHARQYFNLSAWTDTTLHALQDRARQMLAMNIAEDRTSAFENLKWVDKSVDNYYQARRDLTRSGSIYSLRDLDNFISKMNGYRTSSPLKNNTSLVSDLNDAIVKAKRSYADYIISRCNNVASSYRSYGSYESFYDAYTNVSNMIKDYVQKYGNSSWFDYARRNLNEADKSAMSYPPYVNN